MTDSCPNCGRRSVKPTAVANRGQRIVHGYRCPRCGHQWATARHLPAYSELRQQADRRTRRAAA